MKRISLPVFLFLLSFSSFAQPNYNITDPEKEFKEAKEFFVKEEFSLAYPLLKALRDKYPENTQSSHAYLNQDLEYYYIVCGLKLNYSVAEDAAHRFIDAANNEPRQQLMSYHLAKYYFGKGDFARAVVF